VGSGELRGLGTFQNGGFAEFVKVPQEWVFQIPPNISTKEAVMIETFALAQRALKLSEVKSNENIIIFGGGAVGLTLLKALLIEKSPISVIVVEPHEFLRKKALELGANDAVPPRRAKIKKALKSFGTPTFIFDAVGIKDTISDAIFLIKRGGTILIEGIHKESVKFSFFDIISKEVTLKGSFGHDREDILSAIKMFSDGKVNAKDFISEVVPLRNIQTAFEKFLNANSRNFLKILVKA
jgi:2-desacetyl-2-hydroxyethyl bacteriochlorophyllide A dehydrogenase